MKKQLVYNISALLVMSAIGATVVAKEAHQHVADVERHYNANNGVVENAIHRTQSHATRAAWQGLKNMAVGIANDLGGQMANLRNQLKGEKADKHAWIEKLNAQINAMKIELARLEHAKTNLQASKDQVELALNKTREALSKINYKAITQQVAGIVTAESDKVKREINRLITSLDAFKAKWK